MSTDLYPLLALPVFFALVFSPVWLPLVFRWISGAASTYEMRYMGNSYRVVRGAFGRAKIQRRLECPNEDMHRWVSVSCDQCHTLLEGKCK